MQLAITTIAMATILFLKITYVICGGEGGEGGVHLKNFFLAFTDELEKQLSKKLLKWANKKRTNFNTYNVI